MPRVPDDSVEAAAKVMLRQYETEYSADHLTWRDFAGPAREILEAAAPVLAEHAAGAVLAHMERQAGRMPASMAGRWRRYFGIAARVAAGAFSTREDHLREAAGHVNALFAVAQAREQAAALILAQKEPCPEPSHELIPKPSCWTCGRNGAFQRAAMIAAGLRDDLETAATREEGNDA